MIRGLVVLTATAWLVGCASSRSESDIERGRLAVCAALEAWKAKEPAAQLLSRPEPIDFVEELQTTHQLLDYSLVGVDSSDKDVLRYTVTLKLIDKKGKTSTREAVYAVALRSPIAITRDPYY
ncbi:MAG: hypothetical protein RMJ56_13510 [Gemmataceae bacterium]|nr:hypothetical protein [Gemmata sp.]MDW8198610.1 hypothetical protein [Gemmataceae bacterium]